MADLFPRSSVVRRVNSEPALLLGAGRALLLQLAHPAVAQGVADHSGFKVNPFTRLQGTLEAVNAVVYGSTELAGAVGRRVRRVHDHIVGPTYAANEPENLLWVHATLVDTALLCHEELVAPLSPAVAEAYYEEMQVVAEVFGVPRTAQPPTLADFRDYVADTVASLEVTDTGRDLAAFITRPILPLGLHVPLGPALEVQRLFAVGQTPRRLRRELGLRWTPADARAYAVARAAVRAAFRVSPTPVRTVPTKVLGAFLMRGARRRHAVTAGATAA